MAPVESYFVGEVDTSAVPAAASADFWAEHVCRNQGNLQFRFADAPTFRGSMSMQGDRDYLLIDVCSDDIVYRRTRKDIRYDDDAGLRLAVPTAGVLDLRQDDRAVRVCPGQAAIVTKTRPADFRQPRDTRARVLSIPAGALPLDSGAGPVVVDLEQGLGPVVAGMVGGLVEQRAALDGYGFAAACRMIVELLGLCLRPTGKASTTLGTVDLAVRDYVRAHATEPELTPASIAHSLGWSLRQIQLALHGTGTTPSRLIRTERLAVSYRLLRHSPADRTIADIAYTSGFRSLSAFGAAFKERYGCAPYAVRRAGFRAGDSG
ncbi:MULTISPECIES: AraC family transcriptional regulator [Nocardia]|uniref:AraC family transcriptional regulator n=1 Tax=Nocardia TaxID=1817 RepID=UPI0018931524|nr:MULTISPECIES: AraC family transcriptional regulator [Nocardia]MBF6352456.1 AraC family transcriptional regulator [Nocardia flavorosea]